MRLPRSGGFGSAGKRGVRAGTHLALGDDTRFHGNLTWGAGEHVPIVSPLTGRPCVLNITLAGFFESADEELSRERIEFWLQDASGRVLIRPENALVYTLPDRLQDGVRALISTQARTIGTASDAQRQWAQSCLGRRTQFAHLEEHIIQEGQRIEARGRMHWEGGTPVMQAASRGEMALVGITAEQAQQREQLTRLVALGLMISGACVMVGAAIFGLVKLLLLL